MDTGGRRHLYFQRDPKCRKMHSCMQLLPAPKSAKCNQDHLPHKFINDVGPHQTCSNSMGEYICKIQSMWDLQPHTFISSQGFLQGKSSTCPSPPAANHPLADCLFIGVLAALNPCSSKTHVLFVFCASMHMAISFASSEQVGIEFSPQAGTWVTHPSSCPSHTLLHMQQLNV